MIGRNHPCPCHSGAKFKRCCQSYLQNLSAPTPVHLMRSRFTAYALGKVDYILRTTHPQGPPFRQDTTNWSQEVAEFCERTQFLDLEILDHGLDGGEKSDQGWVHFRATLLREGQDASFSERSLFRRQDSRWLYVSGVAIFPACSI
jgi:SEC-C motif-containing protein